MISTYFEIEEQLRQLIKKECRYVNNVENQMHMCAEPTKHDKLAYQLRGAEEVLVAFRDLVDKLFPKEPELPIDIPVKDESFSGFREDRGMI